MLEGWLIDCYPDKKEGMIFWIKRENDNRIIKLRDNIWRNKIYAVTTDDPSYVSARIAKNKFVMSVKHTYKRADFQQKSIQKVLEIEPRDADKTRQTAEALEGMFQNPLTFKLYNVDVLPEQTYFYEKEIFPLGLAQVETSGDQITNWKLVDHVKSIDYKLPELKILGLDITISTKVPRFDSRLVEMSLSDSGGTITYKGNESEIIERAHDEIIRTNPDFIVTRNGDLFVLPYLYSKAQRLGVDFNLNRDNDMKPSHLSSVQNNGTTFFSYGRILFKAKMQKLYGRVHLDEANTFVFDQCRFDGLFEIARLCRMPLHNAVRASIGKCLSSLQFYYASKKDILIPWKPWTAEDPKTFHELLVQDRGGLVLEPLPGIHEHVGEIDFSSLYPSIICKYNISAETLNCKCCKEIGHSIEGLDLHICTQENGLVAESLRLPLEKRLKYRQMRDSTNDKQQKKIYKRRADALKWILVCCFGYLSYRNAKFGKIDSHIAVCGYARKTLLQAIRIAEQNGHRIVHGIVDSLWLSKPDATREDFLELCDKISSETGFKIILEGIYKWIVFLPSKTDSRNHVANRYFGCFEGSNEVKVRGIESRRGDAPFHFKNCQSLIFKTLSKCEHAEDLRKVARTECIDIFEEFASRLERHDVVPVELLITRRLSKNLDEYNSQRQLSVNASLKLAREGLNLRAGQSISYVITRYKTFGQNRAVPEELSKIGEYDSERYIELLADCCSTILCPFGVTKRDLLTRSKTL